MKKKLKYISVFGLGKVFATFSFFGAFIIMVFASIIFRVYSNIESIVLLISLPINGFITGCLIGLFYNKIFLHFFDPIDITIDNK